jgi:hypothetical protein
VLHSVGVGIPQTGHKVGPTNWNGHLVAVCQQYLIDTTLYPVLRAHWPHLTGMMAVPIPETISLPRLFGLRPFASVAFEDDDYAHSMVWLDRPGATRWKRGPDTQPWRRVITVAELLATFGTWND